MRYSFIRIILPVSVIVMLLAAFAYLFAYTSQIRQRNAIFELEKVLDEVYRIQLAESKLASEAYHYVVTGREHNRQAYLEEASEVRGHLNQLRDFSLAPSVDRFLSPGVNGMDLWLAQLDSLMARAPFQDSARSNNYLQSTSYVELRHRIFESFDQFEAAVVRKRSEGMNRLGNLTLINMIGFCALVAIALTLLILTYRINAARLRQAFQLKLKQKDREFAAAFMHAPIGKVIINADGKVIRANDSFCDMLGQDGGRLTQYHLFDFAKDSENELDRDEIAQLLEGKIEVAEREKEMTHLLGNPVWVKQTMSVLFSEEKDSQQLIVQMQDITREKESRHLLQESNAELEQFAYTASHDLKEPLRMIDGFMKLLEKNYGDRLDETAQRYIHFASDGARRMNQLLEDLLIYSRATRSALKEEQVDLNRVMEEVKREFQHRIEELSGTLTWEPLPTVQGSNVAIRTVLRNLVANALKYHRSGYPPVVRVSAAEREKKWCIAVDDNGIGIDPAFYDQVFVIFQRLHGRSEYDGSGIGLATCKRLVEKWGGRIGVTSTPGQGSQFFFTIPRVTSLAE